MLNAALASLVVATVLAVAPSGGAVGQTDADLVVAVREGEAPLAMRSQYLVRWSGDLDGLEVEGAHAVRRLGGDWVLVSLESVDAPAAVASSLSTLLGVDVVPNRVLRLFAEPLFDVQWGLENTGLLPPPPQGVGTIDADIDVLDAWAVTKGEEHVVVAVLDSGLNRHHAEFDDQEWTNPGEIAGNGLDDDGNGFVDDTWGWDFVSGDNNPLDTVDGHGSAVAAVLAADHDGFGMAGVAPDVLVMTVRVCGVIQGQCAESDVADGIRYAVENGADIINMSFGGTVSDPAGPLKDAIAAADAAGVVLVAAAGNEGVDVDVVPVFPAALDEVIGVAASDFTDGRWLFSNFGRLSIDLAAPGEQIIAPGPGGPFIPWDGTSFASPHVAGTAALMLAANPCLSSGDVRSLLNGSVDEKPAFAATTVAGGRLNAGVAVANAAAAPTPVFEVRDTITTPPEVVAFLSCHGPTDWTFGDGAIASGPVVEHRYDDIGIFAAAANGASGSAAFEIAVGLVFGDTTGSVFVDDITWLSARWVTKGCNPPPNDEFCPRDRVTRGQMAAFLVRLLGLTDDGGGDLFLDDDGSVFESDIDKLGTAGITKGCNPPINNLFCHNDLVTREQMAAFLHRTGS